MKNMPVRRAIAPTMLLAVILFATFFFSSLSIIIIFLIYVLGYTFTDAYHYLLSLYTPNRLLLLLFLSLAPTLMWVATRQRGYRNLHGSARWSTYREVKSKGYFKKKSGIVLGSLKGNMLTNWTDSHVLLVAPTSSEKSVSTTIPTLLENKENVFVLDINGELYEKTHIWRGQFLGQKIIQLDPTDPSSHKFNPLSIISIDRDTTLADIERIASILYPKLGGDGPMWQEPAKNLFAYSAYYLVLKNAGENLSLPTLSDVNNLWSEEVEKVAKKIESDCKKNPSIMAIDKNGRIEQEIKQFLAITEEVRSLILATLLSRLKIFLDPQVRIFTAETTFSLSDFMYEPTTIYFTVKPNDLNRIAPLINIFLELLLNQLAKKMDEKRRTIYLLLDEFTSIGKLQNIAKAIAYLASYKVRFCFMVSNIKQLDYLYNDEMGVILSNCQVKVFSAVTEPTTQRYIMDLLGNFTLLVRRSGGQVEEVKRPLMTMEEIANLPGICNKKGKPQRGKLIVVIDSMHPVLCERIVYFEMPYFRDKIST